MKLVRLIVVKIIKTKFSFYTCFDLKFFRSGSCQFGGNLIRKHLIKNASSWKVDKVLFFVKNKSTQYSKFCNIHEYFPLEELNDPLDKVVSNLKSITFYNSDSFFIKKSLIASIRANGKNCKIEGRNININDAKLKYDMNHYITKILSSELEIYFIIAIKKNKGIFFNPIKKINFLVKMHENSLESLILEVFTDQTTSPFFSVRKALVELKELSNFFA